MPSITDILNLNQLSMFQTLRKILETNGPKTVRNLLAYKDQILYVWNPEECCLYSLLLSTAHEERPSYQVNTRVSIIVVNYNNNYERCYRVGNNVWRSSSNRLICLSSFKTFRPINHIQRVHVTDIDLTYLI